MENQQLIKIINEIEKYVKENKKNLAKNLIDKEKNKLKRLNYN